MAGPSFLPPFGKRPFVKTNEKPESQDQLDEVKRQETEISDKINPAIVEGMFTFLFFIFFSKRAGNSKYNILTFFC